MKRTIYSCPECGSENVMHDAYVMMNDEDDVRTFDNKICDDCSTSFNQAVETEVDEPAAEASLAIDVAVPDPEPAPVLHGDELLYTLRAMAAFGGGFANHIAAALSVADLGNLERIQRAVPELMAKFGPGSDFYNTMKNLDS